MTTTTYSMYLTQKNSHLLTFIAFALVLITVGCQHDQGEEDSVGSVEDVRHSPDRLEDSNRISGSTFTNENDVSNGETEITGSSTNPRNIVNHTLIPEGSQDAELTLTRRGNVGAQHQILGTGNVDRSGDDDNWSVTDIRFDVFNIEPTDDSMTAIPVVTGIPAVTIPTGEFREVDICSSTFWDVKQIPIGHEIYASFRPTEERPFDVVAVQPPIRYFEHTDSLGAIENASDYKFYRHTVTFSVDLSGDALADIVRTQYCCDEPSTSVHDSDIACPTCSTTYHRDKSGAWVVTNQTPPC